MSVCTYCFRTYSVYLSLRLPAQILYAGIHLCPLAVSRSRFGLRYSCVRGRQRLAFLAVSATGGARKPNPSEGGEGAPAPRTELQKCKPRLSPPEAGCPHPSRCGAAPHRATFPKGKATRSRRKARNLPKCTPQTFLSISFLPPRAKKQLPLARELRSALDFVSCGGFFRQVQ